uniref:Uncharacterized protein n=1 Tax=viral metagenome TaxID=1070528 RepID=A0A6M3JCV3_9ZZZZ
MATQEQYERWKDFAVRMAKTCFKGRRRPIWRDILARVENFFDLLEYNEDVVCVVDWDNSNPYPEGHRYYRKTYKYPCWHCHGTKKPDCMYGCEDGQIYNYAAPLCIGDMCSELSESWNPYYWEDISDEQFEKRDEQFCDPVKCCIRAGLDMAVEPSEGVIGFMAGDIRRMYPEGVPDWITGGADHRWSYWMKDELNGTFAEMPNTARLIL